MREKIYLVFFMLIVPVVQGYTQHPKETLVTSAPFLRIAPDAKASAMGMTGIATRPDMNASYWNIAKTAFIENENQHNGFALSYIPLMANIKSSVSNAYLTGYTKLSENKALSASVNYFSTGNVLLTDETGLEIGNAKPNEFAVAVAYAQAFGKAFSMGLSAKYVQSNLMSVSGLTRSNTLGSGKAFAMDFGLYYKYTKNLSFGLSLSNIGTKMNYEGLQSASSYFLPMNLGVGLAYHLQADDLNTFSFALDLNKLLLPTSQNNRTNLSTFQALTSSFTDNTNGLGGVLSKIQWSSGLDWNIANTFDIRIGAVYQNKIYGFNRFISTGLGYHYREIQFDIAYMTSYDRNLNNTRNSTFISTFMIFF